MAGRRQALDSIDEYEASYRSRLRVSMYLVQNIVRRAVTAFSNSYIAENHLFFILI